MKKSILFIILFVILVLTVVIIFFLKNNSGKYQVREYKNQLENENLVASKKAKTAKLYLESAIMINNIKEIVQAYKILGGLSEARFKYQESLEYYLKALEYSEELKTDNFKSDIYYKIGCNYLSMGEYINAYTFAMLSYSLDKNSKQTKKYAETLNLLGNIYEKTGLYTNSLTMHYESLEIQKLEKNYKGVANSYHNIGHIDLITERYDRAYYHYNKALGIYDNLYATSADSSEIKKNLVKIYLSIGNYFIIRNDSINALKNLLHAFSLSKEANNKPNIALSFSYIANVYFHNSNYSKAMDYYLRSLKINSEVNNKIGILTNNINIGRIQFLTGKINNAIETFKHSLNLATEINANKQIAEVSEILLSIYTEFPDSIAQTKKYATIYIKSKKYIPNEVIRDSLLQLSVKYEVTAKKNEEISLERYKTKIKILILACIFIVTLTVVVFKYYRNRILQRSLYEKKLSEEKLIRIEEVLKATEQERKRIAIDLHDSLGQVLTMAKMNLSGLEGLMENQNKNNQKIYNDSINQLDQSCEELRNISFNIMPTTLIKYGLKSAIEEIIFKINDIGKIKINFKFKGIDKQFEESKKIVIYRVIQEILNNILKHSNATLASVYMEKNDKSIKLSVEDNGKGMEYFQLYQSKGMGWSNIFSRVEMLNGSIEVNTGGNKGTKIFMVFPDKNIGE